MHRSSIELSQVLCVLPHDNGPLCVAVLFYIRINSIAMTLQTRGQVLTRTHTQHTLTLLGTALSTQEENT